MCFEYIIYLYNIYMCVVGCTHTYITLHYITWQYTTLHYITLHYITYITTNMDQYGEFLNWGTPKSSDSGHVS